jgi:hypothetical protein
MQLRRELARLRGNRTSRTGVPYKDGVAKKIKNKFFCDTYLDMEVLMCQKSAIVESQRSWDGGDMLQALKGASARVAHTRHNGAWGAREGAGTT